MSKAPMCAASGSSRRPGVAGCLVTSVSQTTSCYKTAPRSFIGPSPVEITAPLISGTNKNVTPPTPASGSWSLVNQGPGTLLPPCPSGYMLTAF